MPFYGSINPVVQCLHVSRGNCAQRRSARLRLHWPGPQVEAFESKLKDWVTSPHVLTLNSGTSALHLALRLAGVEHGDEVISTAMTCMATNVPILANGARIVWADINPKTGNLCPKSVAEKITPKTKAIVCVDWGGYPCDFTELRAIADQHKIALIEDAAHAFGATYKNQKMAALPDFTTFSFQAIKHVTTVDGGAHLPVGRGLQTGQAFEVVRNRPRRPPEGLPLRRGCP
ncbi:DegT/DnrJ/EryC1/StrS family aminotransferase [Verrucomicrobium spinosum]|uniref:DegT/DnrJ/EryC1/StrS family aminotransferase n=1 Tax=Verrucomicrobium spinosum TaxID=2736 RepID=UPI0012E17A86